MTTHLISHAPLTIEEVGSIVFSDTRLELGPEAREAVIRCRSYLDERIATADKPIYGITTGFGSLCNVSIESESLRQLQRNLVMSHACGSGDEVPAPVVRLMMFLKIRSLSYGNSGVRIETLERLVDFYNAGVVPVVYQQGSLGASGDLAPLAHMCLPMLGLGEAFLHGERLTGDEVCRRLGVEPITLGAKGGLALLNGTQFMSAYAVWCLLEARRLSGWADRLAALSIEAFDGCPDAFREPVHRVRPHHGQLDTARTILSLLEGSAIASRPKPYVQDPYSFRCAPQVHGAVKDTIDHVESVVTTEINSVTDNPTILPDDDMILSAGNFHGEPLALVLDYLAIALSELASISSQRVYQLIGGKRGLPAFLVAEPGLNSGFMIPQYSIASVVSQNKQLSTPASVDSIESSLGQEDHVSMGANAATKCARVVDNVWRVLGVELMNAAQALDFRRPLKSSDALERLHAAYRGVVSFVDRDRVLYHDMSASVDFLKDNRHEDYN
ncbi:MAG: histidine ammonia-lyase [Rikenellaceae bacterium]|nr:histidine ammonia-lyase [Rikenellaceae bacterium]